MNETGSILKGSLTTLVLKLLSENGRMYGYEITKMVKELSNGSLQITEGALYPALHKLEADGLVEIELEEVNNRPRKYYTLTKKGKKETVAKLQNLAEFLTRMQLLLNLKPA